MSFHFEVSIPFLFSVALGSNQDLKAKSSFNNELRKITRKLGPVLEKNELKDQENPIRELKCQSGLPYKRRARSSSPPKTSLKFFENKIALFPCGAPVVALENGLKYEEDDELRAIKEDYLKLLESAQENRTTECEEYDEEYEIQKIMTKLGY